MLLMPGLGLSLGRSRRRHGAAPFQPAQVPEIAAGYYWDAGNTTGFGTTGFRVIEGGGRSSFDLVQATVANQPTLLTENGGQQFRMRKQVDANPSRLATAAVVTAGWTGPTYVGMWARFPDAGGDIGANALFTHNLTTGNQRRLNITTGNGTPDITISTMSSDGVLNNNFNARSVNPFAGASFTWVEFIVDIALALGGSAPNDVYKVFGNLARATMTLNQVSTVGALFDGAAQINVFSSLATSNADTTDWAACYYGNGIPSLANRVRLANYRNPTGIPLTA